MLKSKKFEEFKSIQTNSIAFLETVINMVLLKMFTHLITHLIMLK